MPRNVTPPTEPTPPAEAEPVVFDLGAGPKPAGTADGTPSAEPAVLDLEGAPTEDGPAEDGPVQLSRRERRAAAHGKGEAPKVAGPAGGRLRPTPPAKRNYAARKGG